MVIKRRAKLKRNPPTPEEIEYLQFIRKQPCLICATREPPLEQRQQSDAAHIKTSSGLRAGIVPLCPYHHRRKIGGGSAESHHEMGKDFWLYHFGANRNYPNYWDAFYRSLFEKGMR